MKIRTAGLVLSLSIGIIGSTTAEEDATPTQGTDPEPAIVKKIEELGGSIRRIAINDPDLEIDFHLGRNLDGLLQFETTSTSSSAPPKLDSQLNILENIKNVVTLHLGGTDITDEGLQHIAELTTLRQLHLERTKISDLGLVHLKKLKNLLYLNLYQTGITDQGLSQLQELKSLKKIYLWKSKVTPTGATNLQKALPSLTIDLGWETVGPSNSK